MLRPGAAYGHAPRGNNGGTDGHAELEDFSPRNGGRVSADLLTRLEAATGCTESPAAALVLFAKTLGAPSTPGPQAMASFPKNPTLAATWPPSAATGNRRRMQRRQLRELQQPLASPDPRESPAQLCVAAPPLATHTAPATPICGVARTGARPTLAAISAALPPKSARYLDVTTDVAVADAVDAGTEFPKEEGHEVAPNSFCVSAPPTLSSDRSRPPHRSRPPPLRFGGTFGDADVVETPRVRATAGALDRSASWKRRSQAGALSTSLPSTPTVNTVCGLAISVLTRPLAAKMASPPVRGRVLSALSTLPPNPSGVRKQWEEEMEREEDGEKEMQMEAEKEKEKESEKQKEKESETQNEKDDGESDPSPPFDRNRDNDSLPSVNEALIGSANWNKQTTWRRKLGTIFQMRTGSDEPPMELIPGVPVPGRPLDETGVISNQDAIRFSVQFNLPAETVVKARLLFRVHALRSPQDESLLSETVGPEEAQALLRDMYREIFPKQVETPTFLDKRPSVWPRSSFKDILGWLSQIAFSETILLPPDQLRVRELARKFAAPIDQVEDLWKTFERFDADKSSDLDMTEFTALLQHLLKAPKGVPVPQSRIQHFWREMSRCNSAFERSTPRAQVSSSISFEQFFYWQRLNIKQHQKDERWYTSYQ